MFKDAILAVMLIPARTDTKWFHKFINKRSEVRFIKGRLKFGESQNSAPFPSMVVIFRKMDVLEEYKKLRKEGKYEL